MILVKGGVGFLIPEIPDNIYDGLLQLTYWDNEKNTYTNAVSIAFNSPYINRVYYYPTQPSITDSAVTIRLELQAYQNVDSVNLRIYQNQYLNSSYKSISMEYLGSGIYELSDSIKYTNSQSFYLIPDDASLSQQYYSGNYFVPEINISGQEIFGDYYYLAPVLPDNRDISHS